LQLHLEHSPKEITMKLPQNPQIQEAYANLLLEDRMVFEHAYAVQSKGFGETYLTWMVGSHYAYLGRWNVQFAYWFTGGGLLLWALADLLRIPGLVNEYNKTVALNALEPLAQRAEILEEFVPVQLELSPFQAIPLESDLLEQILGAPVAANTEAVVLEPVPSSQHAVIEFVF
jgi:hypothetical protein